MRFLNFAGFLRVGQCGVVDGAYIRTPAPVQYEDQFVNEKKITFNQCPVSLYGNEITNVVAQYGVCDTAQLCIDPIPSKYRVSIANTDIDTFYLEKQLI